MATEILPGVLDSSEYLNNLPTTSTGQNDKFNQQSLRDERKQNPMHKCKLCSHEFRTVGKLNAHRQKGCVEFTEIGSVAMDCKPIATDFTDSQYGIEKTNEIQAENVDDFEAIDENSHRTKCKKKQSSLECQLCGRL